MRRAVRPGDHADDRSAAALEPRLVFNLTEWVAGNRRLDSAIAGVLEMMELRYTGTGPEGMHLARDKALAKHIVADLGIRRAAHAVVNGRRPRLASRVSRSS